MVSESLLDKEVTPKRAKIGGVASAYEKANYIGAEAQHHRVFATFDWAPNNDELITGLQLVLLFHILPLSDDELITSDC